MKGIAIIAAAAMLAGCTSTIIARDKDTDKAGNDMNTVSVIVEAPSIYGYAKVWHKAGKVLAEACGNKYNPPADESVLQVKPSNVMDLLGTSQKTQVDTSIVAGGADENGRQGGVQVQSLNLDNANETIGELTTTIDKLTALRESVKSFFGKTTVTLKVKCS